MITISTPRLLRRAVTLSLLALGALAGPAAAQPAAPLVTPPSDLTTDTPKNFPRVAFEGQDAVAQRLNRFLRYHFVSNPVRNIQTMFNREYYGIADLWLGDALNGDKATQAVIRDHLLATEVNGEGYVNTHQHASHAHDKGWPFPLWNQTIFLPSVGVDGIAAGWHWRTSSTEKLWVGDYMRMFPKLKERFWFKNAAKGWTLEGLADDGVTTGGGWALRATSPRAMMTSPEGVVIDAYCAPFIQLRWMRKGAEQTIGATPYIEWQREGDSDWSPKRRAYINDIIPPEKSYSGYEHVFFKLYEHPLWQGKIKRLRLAPAPGASAASFQLDSLFTVYDTRMAYNSLYVLASWDYFAWTGDLDFLRVMLPRMRMAMRYMQSEMGGLKHNFIVIPFHGHTGLPGYTLDEKDMKAKLPQGRPELFVDKMAEKDAIKKKSFNIGKAIGANYYDILPFGNEDFYATAEYYACLLRMAALEEAILRNPGWGMDRGVLALEPAALRSHAAQVKKVANQKFWDKEKGRFFGCIDIEGNKHDYGFTFLNQMAIWYDIATPEHARAIMEWIDGQRVIEGDTSTGADIYRWRLAPRATTKRNLEWYHYMWAMPEIIKWGDQVQDGGAVLGFAYFDLISRQRVLGADNAFERLAGIMEWDEDCWQAGGYRAYYKDGKPGTTMQGGGTAGGVGIDMEFLETSMVPAVVIRAFLGLNPTPERMIVTPDVPAAKTPRVGIFNALYRGARMDLAAEQKAGRTRFEVELKDAPIDPLRFELPKGWRLTAGEAALVEGAYELAKPGRYAWEK